MTALSYSSGPSNAPLLGETIPANFRRTAAEHPEAIALVDRGSDRRWTYAEFDRDTDALAAALLERGVRKGDRVGIWAQNVGEWALVQYATAKIGAILVNVNPSYRAHELEYVVRQSGMTLLISQILNPPHTDFHALATEVSGTVPDLDLVFIDTVPAALIGDTAVGERESFARLLDEGRSLLEDPGAKYAVRLEQAAGELSVDDPINIQYTSGTTGFPKGVTLSHHNILNNGYFIAELLSYTPDDSVVLSVPYYHCFGMVMGNLAALSHGASIVLPSPGFDPAASLTAVAEEKATSLYGVPTMFIAELGQPDFSDFDLSSLRTGIMAGSPCPVEVMRHVIDDMNMSEVAICYGMTETSPVSTMTRVDDSLEARTETVGRVMPHVEVKIVDPVTGQTMPRGQKGELCTRGYSVMLGYWEEPEKTAEAIDSARWMHTGDLAIMDDDGYVDISGRIKDMVIRGGENVYPREIEEFLYQHPAISDVQVIGVSDEKYGEELMAWVILKDGYDTLTAEDVREFAAGRLAHFKIPRYVEVRDSFPMTVSGKIRKVELREEGERIVHAS
ncbi:AMP-binding protein [Brevibacterium casei]|uniref:Fatty-acyl-CoA synthase n=1 Tax=Brevibacterium casei CIP 102111 TaxID=1255625 RepID=A0A2H1IFN9_9MICO|nr:AMP-binding protein [Brevibacterium casei]QPR40384.1 AMP-binding protein [Brevibacterium casei]QPR44539.1 AMP-binding protein [Brevibacterium casei]SMX74018.1 fatty-acyl-CoA synthase [Brevibacterium casei CIP 102111]